MTTISDIAKALGITAGTVSRALRSDPRVKESTRLAVLAQVEKTGYVPNRAAQHLARGKSDTIWILLGSLDWIQERNFASACNRRLWQKGYRALIVLHDNNEDKLNMILRDLSSGSADGAMVMPTMGVGTTEIYREVKVPLLFIDRWRKGMKFPVVTSDNARGAGLLLEKALAEDPQISAVICFREAQNDVEKERYLGISETCNAHGLTLCDSVQELPPQALFAVHGNGQTEILNWLNRQPESIQKRCIHIITWDRWMGPSSMPQKVLFAEQDFESMATQATDILLNWIDTGKFKNSRTLVPILGVQRIVDGEGTSD